MTHEDKKKVKSKKSKDKKQILVNVLIVKVCKCGNLEPVAGTTSENCVTKVLEAL